MRTSLGEQLKHNDVIIVGAGPAGIACGLQLNRYDIVPLIFEKNELGGLLLNANNIENYPGFPNGISGIKLVEKFKKQLSKFYLAVVREKVISCDFKENLFYVKTNGGLYYSRILVIASGTKHKKPSGVEISPEATDKVFYEIVPIMNCKRKKIVIAGGGDLAFDYSMNLGKKNEITIINRSEKIKSIPVLKRRIEDLNHFKYFGSTCVKKVSTDGKKYMNIFCESKNGTIKLNAHYLIFAIGREPELRFISGPILKNADALVSNGLLYRIGDVINKQYRQAAIAVGDGVKAAMKINEVLKSLSFENELKEEP